MSQLQAKAALYRLWVLMNGFTLHAVGKQWSWPTKRRRFESWQTESTIRRALLAAGFDRISVTRGRHFMW